MLKHGSALLGLASVALLVPALAATEPPAAAARSATGSPCVGPVFFGLHGVKEFIIQYRLELVAGDIGLRSCAEPHQRGRARIIGER
jgi:hypothetical protein